MMTECAQRLVCTAGKPCPHASPFDNVNCEDPDANETSTFYIAGLEDFSLTINHTVLAPQLFAMYGSKYRARSADMEGAIVRHQGSGLESKKEVLRTIPLGTNDQFTVGDILRYAGLDFAKPLEGHALPNDLRSTGGVIFIYIRYTNTASFFAPTKSISYEYEMLPAKDVETLYIPQSEAGPRYFQRVNRVLTVRRGIKVILLQEGMLSAFDPQALLLTLVTAPPITAF